MMLMASFGVVFVENEKVSDGKNIQKTYGGSLSSKDLR